MSAKRGFTVLENYSLVREWLASFPGLPRFFFVLQLAFGKIHGNNNKKKTVKNREGQGTLMTNMDTQLIFVNGMVHLPHE